MPSEGMGLCAIRKKRGREDGEMMWTRLFRQKQTGLQELFPGIHLTSYMWRERSRFWEQSPKGGFSSSQERQPRNSRAGAVQGRGSASEWKDMPSFPGSLGIVREPTTSPEAVDSWGLRYD